MNNSWSSRPSAALSCSPEHRAQVLGFLPYAFLLACPLAHMFMHHGHHHHGCHGNTGRTDDERTKQ